VRQLALRAAIFPGKSAVRSGGAVCGTIAARSSSARVALRDLKTLSGSLRKFSVRLDRRGAILNPGDLFAVSAPELGIRRLIVRAGRCCARQLF
jgi:hypothetical protein